MRYEVTIAKIPVVLPIIRARQLSNLQPKGTDMHRGVLAKATSPKLPKYCTRLRYQHVTKTLWSAFASYTLQDLSILTRISSLLSSSLQSFGRVRMDVTLLRRPLTSQTCGPIFALARPWMLPTLMVGEDVSIFRGSL